MKIRRFMAMFLSVCLIAASTSMAAYADEIELPQEQEIVEQETAEQESAASEAEFKAEAEEAEAAEPVAEEAVIEIVTEEEEATPSEAVKAEPKKAERIELYAVAEDGMTVTLTAAGDAFEHSEDLELEVSIVSEETAEEASEELEEKTAGDNVAKRVTYDVRVMYEGEEIQPLEGKKVQVEFTMSEVPSGADAVSVYHHNAQTEEIETIVDEEAIDAEEYEVTVSGETESFSLYTVDFTYNEKIFSLSGDTQKNELAYLLKKVDITDPITAVVVYADSTFTEESPDGIVRNGETELYKIYEESSKWYLDSINPFTGAYGIKVTTSTGGPFEVKITGTARDYSVLAGNMSPSEIVKVFENAVDGKVKLTNDVLVDFKGGKIENIYIPKGIYDLFLDGHTLDLYSRGLIATEGAVLNIYSGSDEYTENESAQILSGDNCNIEVHDGGIINIYGGVITGNIEAGVGDGTINQYGGNMGTLYVLSTGAVCNIYGGQAVNGVAGSGTKGVYNVIGGTVRRKITGAEHIGVVEGSFLCQKGKILDPTSYKLAGCTMTGSGSGPFTVSRGTNVAVRIASDGTMTGYTTLADAVKGDGTVVMLTDLKEDLIIDNKVVLNLNGHVLEGTGTGSVITVNEDAEFELFDSDIDAEHTGDYASLPVGGVVTGGKAAKGGAVYNMGSFRMTGGTITGNTADLGGGVYTESEIKMVGRVVIDGNMDTAEENSSNLYLADQAIRGVDDYRIKEGSMIGISTAKAPEYKKPVAVTGTSNMDYSAYFYSDDPELDIIDDNKAVMLADPREPAPEPIPDPIPEPIPEQTSEWTAEPAHRGSAEAPITNGSWNNVSGGWKYYVNGELARNTKAWISYTGADGKQYTGCFYFDKNGKMATGWQLINGTWYYFEAADPRTLGMMYMGKETPDGYKVDANGAWIR